MKFGSAGRGGSRGGTAGDFYKVLLMLSEDDCGDALILNLQACDQKLMNICSLHFILIISENTSTFISSDAHHTDGAQVVSFLLTLVTAPDSFTLCQNTSF